VVGSALGFVGEDVDGLVEGIIVGLRDGAEEGCIE
jgi:hypothetical protein